VYFRKIRMVRLLKAAPSHDITTSTSKHEINIGFSALYRHPIASM
jgi:hypothetical protein